MSRTLIDETVYPHIPVRYDSRPKLPILVTLPEQGFALLPAGWTDERIQGAWEYVRVPPFLTSMPPFFAVVPFDSKNPYHTRARRVTIPTEFCECGKKRSGFRFSYRTFRWICADCRRPTKKWFRDFLYFDLNINLYAEHAYTGNVPRRY